MHCLQSNCKISNWLAYNLRPRTGSSSQKGVADTGMVGKWGVSQNLVLPVSIGISSHSQRLIVIAEG